MELIGPRGSVFRTNPQCRLCAMMLGRLQMTVQDVSREHGKIGSSIFRPKSSERRHVHVEAATNISYVPNPDHHSNVRTCSRDRRQCAVNTLPPSVGRRSCVLLVGLCQRKLTDHTVGITRSRSPPPLWTTHHVALRIPHPACIFFTDWAGLERHKQRYSLATRTWMGMTPFFGQQ